MTVIVPNELRDRINRQLTVALQEWPDATDNDRDALYHQILDYFNRYGVLPEFSIVKAIPA